MEDSKFRPLYECPVLYYYRQLIERCCSPDSKQRPSFDEILNELKTNPDFLDCSIDKENFLEYTQYLDEYPNKFDPNRHVTKLNDILKNEFLSFPDIRPDILIKSIYETEANNIIFSEMGKFLEKNFNINDILGNFYKIGKMYRCLNDNFKVITRMPIKECFRDSIYNNFYKNEIDNFSRELNILFQIKHPSILKFYGFGINYEGPIIICKYSEKGTLEKILEKERIHKYKLNGNFDSKLTLPTHKKYIREPPDFHFFFQKRKSFF